MELELEMFLIDRGAVTQENLKVMKSEKIDMVAIVDMGENILKMYIPKIGDRLATVRFCKCNLPPKMSERSGLVERIRKSQFYEEYASGKKTANNESKEKKIAPNEKSTRIISIGWIMNGNAIRERNGGGTRHIHIEKSAKKEDILMKALDMVFPDAVSAKRYGPLSKYSYDLLDYKQLVFDNKFTVGEMYLMTGLTILRFYLSTIKISESDSSSEAEADHHYKKSKKSSKKADKKKRKPTVEVTNEEDQTNAKNLIMPASLISEVENQAICHNNVEKEEVSFAVGTTFENCYTSDLLESDRSTLNEFLIFDDLNFTKNEAGSNSQCSETLSSSKTVILHRGRIFVEMTDKFSAIESMNTLIEIQIIGTNGVKEKAYDGGGVFKDALTEYWNEFYDRLCVGSTTKIPEVNYLFNDIKWKSIAKILIIGYRQTNYFPVKLSRPFIEFAIFEQSFTDLTRAFMKFIPPLDADVINRAILNIDSVDTSELVDTLTNLECKQVVNKENITDVIQQLAHTEIIQKSLYIVQTWRSVLKNSIPLDTLDEIYNKSEVTTKSVLQLIQNFVYEELDENKERVLNFLRKFIREADIDILTRFLRFCTGADIITCESITIEASHQTVPTSHTCNNILSLPIHYDSYRSFKSEFTNILRSDMWCMDIV